MFEYRITKYDPALRSANGAYARREWTSKSDIGRSFEGVELTPAAYQRVEDAYIDVALAFLAESGIRAMRIRYLEKRDKVLPFGNGSILSMEQVATMIRGMLREDIWCKLEATHAFVHIGYDYYMYVGVPSATPNAQIYASTQGLFVEPFRSPYADEFQ